MPIIDYMDCFFTGPDTIAGKYMRKYWHPVARAEDLRSGWVKPIRILSEDFTLYRGESGRAQVVGFRCPHRQSTLAVGWVEGDCIRCRFHGWKFDSSGQCVEQPAGKKPLPKRSGSAVVRRTNILDLSSSISARAILLPYRATRISSRRVCGWRLISSLQFSQQHRERSGAYSLYP